MFYKDLSHYNHQEGRLGTAAEIHRSQKPSRPIETPHDTTSMRREYEQHRADLHNGRGIGAEFRAPHAEIEEIFGEGLSGRQREETSGDSGVSPPSAIESSIRDQDERRALQFQRVSPLT